MGIQLVLSQQNLRVQPQTPVKVVIVFSNSNKRSDTQCKGKPNKIYNLSFKLSQPASKHGETSDTWSLGNNK